MRHPAEHYIKYLLLKDETEPTDSQIQKNLQDWGFLSPLGDCLGTIRQQVNRPQGFRPLDRTHKPSAAFIRKHKVHDLFFPTDEVNEAWDILSDPEKRLMVEQLLMARIDPVLAAAKINKARGWLLTKGGIEAFGHFFWNVKLLTFDEWGQFLYNRTAMYDRHMALLQSNQQLAFFHLRLEQVTESKHMIQRAQEIAYYTLEEVSQKSGTDAWKVKAIGVLTKSIVDCHEALSTSDMALKDILKQFEQFRMAHPQQPPPDIKQLAPAGNFTGSGVEEKDPEKAN